EGNDQQAYLLLFRQVQLVLNHITFHPDAKNKSNRLALAQARRAAETSLSKLEEIRPRIAKSYDRHVKAVQARKARQGAPSHSESDKVSVQTVNELQDPALTGRAQPLVASEHKDLAVKLAQKEFRRRATIKKV